jgi:hypothetical protein
MVQQRSRADGKASTEHCLGRNCRGIRLEFQGLGIRTLQNAKDVRNRALMRRKVVDSGELLKGCREHALKRLGTTKAGWITICEVSAWNSMKERSRKTDISRLGMHAID